MCFIASASNSSSNNYPSNSNNSNSFALMRNVARHGRLIEFHMAARPAA